GPDRLCAGTRFGRVLVRRWPSLAARTGGVKQGPPSGRVTVATAVPARVRNLLDASEERWGDLRTRGRVRGRVAVRARVRGRVRRRAGARVRGRVQPRWE